MKKITLEKYAMLIKLGDKSKISEASINRVAQHIKSTASKSFSIITAERDAFTNKENLGRNKKLESDIRSLGLGFFKLKGHWMECKDSKIDYSECPDDMKVPVVEISLFVPNITLKDTIRLAKKYNQDSAVYQGPETKNKVELISKSGSSIAKLGSFSPNSIGRAYSKVKGKSFTFEGFEWIPKGMLTNMALEAYLKKIVI